MALTNSDSDFFKGLDTGDSGGSDDADFFKSLGDAPDGDTKQSQDHSIMGDMGTEAEVGVTSTLQGLSSLIGADGATEYYRQKTKELSAKLSPEQKAADKEEIAHKSSEGSSFNPFNYDWTMPSARKVSGMLAQSLFATGISMGIGGVATKGLAIAGNSLGRGAAAAAVKGGVPLAKQAVKHKGAITGAVGFGVGEGAVGAGQSGSSVFDAVLALKPEVIAQSPEYQKLITDGASQHEAQLEVAKRARNQAEWDVGITTTLLGAPMGAVFAGWFGRKAVSAGALGKALEGATRKGNVALGTLGEAGQGFTQGITEQVSQNKAVKEHADPTQDIGKGVFDNAIGGALADGIMGGALGVAAPVHADKQDNSIDLSQANDRIEQQSQQQGTGIGEFADQLDAAAGDQQVNQNQAGQADVQPQQDPQQAQGETPQLAGDAPTPEAYPDLEAQAQAVSDGRKPAILVTDGAEAPEEALQGMQAVPVEGGILYTNQPVKNTKRTGTTIGGIPVINDNGSLNGQVLGHASSVKPADNVGATTEGIDANGNIVHQEVGQSPEASQAAQKVAGEGGQVRVIPTDQAIQEREQRRQADLQSLNETAGSPQAALQRQARLQRMQKQAEAEQQQAEQERIQAIQAQIQQAKDIVATHDAAMATGKYIPDAEHQAEYDQAQGILRANAPQQESQAPRAKINTNRLGYGLEGTTNKVRKYDTKDAANMVINGDPEHIVAPHPDGEGFATQTTKQAAIAAAKASETAEKVAPLATESAKPDPKQKAKADSKTSKPTENFLQRVADLGGISLSQVADVTGETKARGVRPGLFKKSGRDIADIANEMGEEYGFDGNDKNAFIEKLQSALSAKKEGRDPVLSVRGTQDREDAKIAEAENQQAAEDSIAIEQMGGEAYLTQAAHNAQSIQDHIDAAKNDDGYVFIDGDIIPADAVTLEDVIAGEKAYEEYNNRTQKGKENDGRNGEATGRHNGQDNVPEGRNNLPGQEESLQLTGKQHNLTGVKTDKEGYAVLKGSGKRRQFNTLAKKDRGAFEDDGNGYARLKGSAETATTNTSETVDTGHTFNIETDTKINNGDPFVFESQDTFDGIEGKGSRGKYKVDSYGFLQTTKEGHDIEATAQSAMDVAGHDERFVASRVYDEKGKFEGYTAQLKTVARANRKAKKDIAAKEQAKFDAEFDGFVNDDKTQTEGNSQTAAPEGEMVAKAKSSEKKEPWQMTKSEYLDGITDTDEVAVAKAAHANHVKKAVADGETVPLDVLESYKINHWAKKAISQQDDPELKISDQKGNDLLDKFLGDPVEVKKRADASAKDKIFLANARDSLKREIEDWKTRSYKDNKNTVSVGEVDTDRGEGKEGKITREIGYINNKRRDKRIRSMEKIVAQIDSLKTTDEISDFLDQEVSYENNHTMRDVLQSGIKAYPAMHKDHIIEDNKNSEQTSKAPKQDTPLGVNKNGFPIYEDENGVRSYVENGIIITQPVTLDGQGMPVVKRMQDDYIPVKKRPMENADIEVVKRMADTGVEAAKQELKARTIDKAAQEEDNGKTIPKAGHANVGKPEKDNRGNAGRKADKPRIPVKKQGSSVSKTDQGGSRELPEGQGRHDATIPGDSQGNGLPADTGLAGHHADGEDQRPIGELFSFDGRISGSSRKDQTGDTVSIEGKASPDAYEAAIELEQDPLKKRRLQIERDLSQADNKANNINKKIISVTKRLRSAEVSKQNHINALSQIGKRIPVYDGKSPAEKKKLLADFRKWSNKQAENYRVRIKEITANIKDMEADRKLRKDQLNEHNQKIDRIKAKYLNKNGMVSIAAIQADQVTPLYSKGSTTKGQSVEATKQSLIKSFGAAMARAIEKGKVVIHRTAINAPEGVKRMVAYHGGPHDHNKFSNEHIGTGEGAQAYGWGLYFAGARKVAEWYREKLSGDRVFKTTEEDLIHSEMEDLEYKGKKQSKNNVLEGLRKRKGSSSSDAYNKSFADNFDAAIAGIEDGTYSVDDYAYSKGKLYQVELAPKEDEYLLWDKPLSEQSDKVKAAIGEEFINDYTTGEEYYKQHSNNGRDMEDASQSLHGLGIRGIKYLDGSSRSKGEGNYNYVIFDDADISITAKFSKDGKIQGWFDKDGTVNIVAENNDESTLAGVLLHEAKHSFDESKEGRAILAKGIRQIRAAERLAKSGRGKVADWIQEAKDAIPSDTPEKDYYHELFAYAVQQYHDNIAAMPNTIKNIIKRYLDALVGFIRAHLLNVGFNIKVTPAALVSLARGEVRSLGKREGVFSGEGAYASIAKEYGISVEEAKRQFDAVVAKYKGTDQWLKAPNGKATKLNERQWVQVRTPAFKAWFGEWEAEATLVDKAQSFIKKALSGSTPNPMRLWTVDDTMAKEISGLIGTDVTGFDFVLNASDIRHAKREHGNKAVEAKKKQEAITESDLLAIPYILKSPDYIRKGSSKGSRASVIFGKRVNGTVEFVEVVLKNGKLTNKTMWKKKGATRHQVTFDPARQDAPSMYRSIDDFLEKAIPSKVVDENGEPMVVYHGTDKSFDIFNRGLLKWGAERSEFADEYAFAREATHTDKPSANIMPVFMRVTAPFDGDKIPRTSTIDDFIDELVTQAEDNGVEFKPGDESRLKNMLKKSAREEESGSYYSNHDFWNDAYSLFGAKGYDAIKEAFTLAGFDGATFTEGGKEKTHGVLYSNFIKSATGNTGQFTGNNPDIRYSKAPKKLTASQQHQKDAAILKAQNQPIESQDAWNLEETWKEKLEAKMLYRFNRIKKLGHHVFGEKLPGNANAAEEEALFYGHVGKEFKGMERNHLKPATQILAKNGMVLDDLEQFMYATHAPEVNAVVRKMDENNDSGSGITDQEAQDILDGYSVEQRAHLKEAASYIRSMLDHSLDLMVEHGLETKEFVDMLKKKYPNYVPLSGNENDESIVAIMTGKKFDIRGKETKARTGRYSKAIDLIPNAINQAQATAIRAHKATVGQSIAKMYLANQDKEIWELNKIPVKKYVSKTGQIFEGSDKQLSMYDTEETTSDGKIVYRADPSWKQKDNVFAFKVDARQYFLTIHDKALARQLKGLGVEQSGVVINTLGRLNRVLAGVYTSLSPEFVVTNAMRDIQTALINLQAHSEHISKLTDKDPKKLKREVLKEWGTSLITVLKDELESGKGKHSEYWEEYQNNGGKVSFFSMQDADSLRGNINREIKLATKGKHLTLKTFIKIAKYVQGINAAVENAVRLSAYVALRKRGVPAKDAAYIGRNLTVDFNRKGESGALANALFLFYNASIQGSRVVVNATRMMAKSGKGQAAIAGMIATGFVLAEITRQAMGQGDDGRDRWDTIPDYNKQRNLIFPTGDGKDYGKFMMPYGFSLFSNAGYWLNDLYHYYSSEGKQGKSPLHVSVEMVKAILNSYNPVGGSDLPLPTVLKPGYELLTNEDYAQRPINKEQSPYAKYPKPDAETYYHKYDNSLEHSIASALNSITGGDSVKPGFIDIGPGTLNYWMKFFTGGMGNFVTSTGNIASKAIHGDEIKGYEVPFYRKITGGIPDYQSVKDYRLNIQDPLRRYDEWRHANGVDQIKLKREYAKEIRLGQIARVKEKVMRRQYKIRKAHEGDKTSIDRINKKIQSIANEYNKRYHAIMGAD